MIQRENGIWISDRESVCVLWDITIRITHVHCKNRWRSCCTRLGVALKDLLQPLSPDVFHRAPQGDGHRGQGVPTLHPGEGREGAGGEPLVEGLAPGGEEIEAALVGEHQVNDAGLREPLLIQGGKDHRVDVGLQSVKNVLGCHVHSSPKDFHRARGAPKGTIPPKRPVGAWLQAVLLGRVAGEVGDHPVGAPQIEHLEDGVVGGLVLALYNGVLHAHLLDRHIVLKHGLPAEPNPGVGGAGHGDLNVGVGLHVLVDLLGAVGAEPQPAVPLPGEHEGAALGLAVPAHGGQVLDRILIQKFHDFVHDKLPPKVFAKRWIASCCPNCSAVFPL